MTTLADLDERQRNDRFDRLQAGMEVVWEAMRLDYDDESVVVVPSVAVDPQAVGSAGIVQAFEERLLFLLLLLRQPRLRMVYVTSTRIEPRIVEYYLALLPGVIPSHARERLTLISVDDSTLRPLSEKLLERPRALALIAEAIPNRERCHLIAYSTTHRERDLALTFGVPVYGCDPRLSDLGSKTGCRRLFAEEGVRHPGGAEDLHGPDDVVAAVAGLLADCPDTAEVIVKLNDGAAGNGNARVDLRDHTLEQRDLGLEGRTGTCVDRSAHDPALAGGVDDHRGVELGARDVGSPDVEGVEPRDGDGRQGSESERRTGHVSQDRRPFWEGPGASGRVCVVRVPRVPCRRDLSRAPAVPDDDGPRSGPARTPRPGRGAAHGRDDSRADGPRRVGRHPR